MNTLIKALINSLVKAFKSLNTIKAKHTIKASIKAKHTVKALIMVQHTTKASIKAKNTIKASTKAKNTIKVSVKAKNTIKASIKSKHTAGPLTINDNTGICETAAVSQATTFRQTKSQALRPQRHRQGSTLARARARAQRCCSPAMCHGRLEDAATTTSTRPCR